MKKIGYNKYKPKLTPEKLNKIHEMLAEREFLIEKVNALCHRNIAKEVGMSRSTIQKISVGQRHAPIYTTR
jgi:hypothetical protein